MSLFHRHQDHIDALAARDHKVSQLERDNRRLRAQALQHERTIAALHAARREDVARIHTLERSLEKSNAQRDEVTRVLRREQRRAG